MAHVVESFSWVSTMIVLEPKVDPLDFSGVYRDPKHPGGYRVVRTGGPGVIYVAAQDRPDGPVLQLSGSSTYDPKSGKTNLQIDIPNKDGSIKVLSGVYSPDQLLYVNFCETGEILTMGSMGFPDGNVWVKDNGLQGVYVDSKALDGYVVLRELGNAKVRIEKADRVDQMPTTLSAVINKSEGVLVVDLSPIGGSKRSKAAIKNDQLMFQDGTIWTKL